MRAIPFIYLSNGNNMEILLTNGNRGDILYTRNATF